MNRTIKELDRDFRRELAARKESSEEFAVIMTSYLRENWTLEEIENFSTIYDCVSRYERAFADNWLRAFWANWLRVVADYKSKADFMKLDEKQLLALTPAAAQALLPHKVEETEAYKKQVQIAASTAGRLKRPSKDL